MKYCIERQGIVDHYHKYYMYDYNPVGKKCIIYWQKHKSTAFNLSVVRHIKRSAKEEYNILSCSIICLK